MDQLERAIAKRSPILAERLQAGLSETKIRKMLSRKNVEGNVEPIVILFSWKNGSRLDPSLTREQATPFPGSPYIFMDFQMMLADFHSFRVCVARHPRYAKIVEQYFPLFWDGSNRWLAVDLEPATRNRIVSIDTQTERMIREVSPSFQDFISEAILANERNQKLNSLI